MRLYRSLRSTEQLRVELWIDACPNLGRCIGTSGERFEHLHLAQQAMLDVLVDLLGGLVDQRAVAGVDDGQLELGQSLQRGQVGSHVAIWWRDQRRTLAQDRVACEQGSCFRPMEAHVIGTMAWRRNDVQVASTKDHARSRRQRDLGQLQPRQLRRLQQSGQRRPQPQSELGGTCGMVGVVVGDADGA